MRSRTKLLLAVLVVLLLLFLRRRPVQVQVGPTVTLGNDPVPLAVLPQLFPKPVIGPISVRPVPVQAEVLTSAPQNPYTRPADILFPCMASQPGVGLPTDLLLPASQYADTMTMPPGPTDRSFAGAHQATEERAMNETRLEAAFNRMIRNERLCDMQTFEQRQREFDLS